MVDSAWIKVTAADQAKLAKARSRNLWQGLCDAAALDPAKVALVAADDEGQVTRITYGDLIARIRAFSAGLASIGVQHGDRVVLWMTNRIEWIISNFAIARIGAVTVPINTFLKTPEVGYCIAQSRADHVIMMDRFRNVDMIAMLAELAPPLKNVVLFERHSPPAPLGEGHCQILPSPLGEGLGVGTVGRARRQTTDPTPTPPLKERDYKCHDWSALESTEEHWLAKADAMAATVIPDDLHLIKYTSGSTGFPKGVMLQQGGWLAEGLLHGERAGMGRDDVYFSMMPFFHAGGSMYGLMSMLPIGGRLVFTEAFNVDLAVRLIVAEHASIFVSVLGKEVVLAADAAGISFPKIWLAHVFNDVARRVMPNARFAFSPFGLTETYGPASLTGPDDPADKHMVTGGRPLPGNEVRVVDPETLQDCAPDVVGEAWIRGNLALGYWDKPEESAKAFDKEGWLHSEDLVSVDSDGFVTFRGRIKLMAKVGGENVSLEEVERVVCGHEAITHCAAVAVADSRKVEAIRVYVVMHQRNALDAATLTAWLKPRIAHFKLPRDIVFVDELPRLANGKLNRHILREWALEDVG